MKTGILGRITGAAHDVCPWSLFRGTGKSRSAAAYARYRISGHPNAPHHWHDRNDGAQLRTLEAAQAKRDRKAEKLRDLSDWELNPAHLSPVYRSGVLDGWTRPGNLNPFYVAK